MSGEKYNYIHIWLDEPLELLEREDDVRAIYKRLCELKSGSLAAKKTKLVLEDLEQLKQYIAQLDYKFRNSNLHEVWRALGYDNSGDWSEQEVIEAITQLEASDATEPT